MVAQTIERGLRPTDVLGRWLDQELLAILKVCGISFIVQYLQKPTEEAAPAARRGEGTKAPGAKQAGSAAEQGAKSTAAEAAAATPGNPPEKK
jgi:hypothetical protein